MCFTRNVYLYYTSVVNALKIAYLCQRLMCLFPKQFTVIALNSRSLSIELSVLHVYSCKKNFAASYFVSLFYSEITILHIKIIVGYINN